MRAFWNVSDTASELIELGEPKRRRGDMIKRVGAGKYPGRFSTIVVESKNIIFSVSKGGHSALPRSLGHLVHARRHMSIRAHVFEKNPRCRRSAMRADDNERLAAAIMFTQQRLAQAVGSQGIRRCHGQPRRRAGLDDG